MCIYRTIASAQCASGNRSMFKVLSHSIQNNFVSLFVSKCLIQIAKLNCSAFFLTILTSILYLNHRACFDKNSAYKHQALYLLSRLPEQFPFCFSDKDLAWFSYVSPPKPWLLWCCWNFHGQQARTISFLFFWQRFGLVFVCQPTKTVAAMMLLKFSWPTSQPRFLVGVFDWAKRLPLRRLRNMKQKV